MSIKNWTYHLPEFESDQYNPEMMKYSPWSGHRTFGYDYVANVKPKRIVELGSYYGCSAFSFQQAVKDLKLDIEFSGIDTWAGDSFTTSDYQEDIYGDYKAIQDKCFSSQNSKMLRMTFDEAVSMFEDESIDLLHIDGSHLYEDVKHDFETWKCKVKKNGVIFFHDISSDKLDGKLLGSHLFWKEIKALYPYTTEFTYSFGLGLLFFDQNMYEDFISTVSLDHYQQIVNHLDVEYKDVIRKRYFEVRDLKKYVQFLKDQLEADFQNLSDYKDTVGKKDQYIEELEHKAATLAEKIKESFDELQSTVSEYESTVSGKDRYIQELQDTIRKYSDDVAKKENYITELVGTISAYEENVRGKDSYIESLKEDLSRYAENVAGKDAYIQELETGKKWLEDQIAKKDKLCSDLEVKVADLNHIKSEIASSFVGRRLLKKVENTND